jgi:hypothetical protein
MAFIEIPAKNPTWEKIRESVLSSPNHPFRLLGQFVIIIA